MQRPELSCEKMIGKCARVLDELKSFLDIADGSKEARDGNDLFLWSL